MALLVASLGLVSAALGISQADLQSGHVAAVCHQGGLQLGHCGLQLVVLLLQTARDGERQRGLRQWDAIFKKSNCL
ncbi:hypothetical protein EYF80_012144 [Liparis tanakae]|uniref:Uncharacterized protein n=1 Tax=Liparis tanakae TaxID=230148 RepID=A0A4Z2IJC4_9TELE|nr:hypothetical protein EYF80_012144 [Liparis tanakae]